MRVVLAEALKVAMKSKMTDRISTIRLINASIKDRDIALRGEGSTQELSDKGILTVLAKMIKQRNDSAVQFEEAGRDELANKERLEIKIIEEFMPTQLDPKQVSKIVAEAVRTVNAKSIRDMGHVMSFLKENYAGQIDFNLASSLIKKSLL
jgi:hypothetical protein